MSTTRRNILVGSALAGFLPAAAMATHPAATFLAACAAFAKADATVNRLNTVGDED